MKRWILFLAICLTRLCISAPLQDRTLDPQELLILGSALGIAEGSDFIAETQKRWLRPSGQERWEMDELSAEQRAFVLEWGKEHGLFAQWQPSLSSYDTALILGATTCRMQMRLDYLKELWNDGVRFEQIVWLTGDRPLDKRIDRQLDGCATESDAARSIWQITELPEEMRQLPVVFVAVPMFPGRRPNTEDTIIAWLETQTATRTALFVSDQPFCGYQFAVVNSILPDAISFDLIGRGVDPHGHPAAAAITLDSIARWIYQESLSAN
ncbi:MAG: hypothetical protein V4492_03935 [Chlamydiota bacterium]